MRGRNHIIANLSCATVMLVAMRAVSDNGLTQVFDGYLTIESICSSLVLLVFGTLLPDIDSPKSILGRHVKWVSKHVAHRTWTHTIWALFLVSIPALWWDLWWAVSLGYLGHLVFDSLSVAGVCWFYPLEQYKVIDHGTYQVRVKRHHWGIYKVGTTSETMVTMLCVIAALGSVIWYTI